MSAKLMKFGYGRGGRRNRLLILNPARGLKFESSKLERPTETTSVRQK